MSVPLENLKVGDVVKVNLKLIPNQGVPDQHRLKIVRQILKNGNGTAKIFRNIRAQATINVNKCPAWLIRLPVFIANDTNDVKLSQAFDQAVHQIEIVNPDVVMHEYQEIGSIVGKNPLIIDFRQSTPILIVHMRTHTFIVLQTF